MIPEHFYITSLGVMAYGFIYVPTILAVAVLLWRIFRLSWKVNAPITLLLLTLPFWDVYMIGRDADRLCKSEAGLHVYKTVEAEGVAAYNSKYWLDRGFKYVEHSGVGPNKYYRKYRDTFENGEIVSNEISEFTVQFDSKTADNHKVITKSISRTSAQVFNIGSGEVLSEWTTFNIYPGLFDGILLKFVGSGPVIWHCGYESSDGKENSISSLVLATIKPLNSKGNEQ